MNTGGSVLQCVETLISPILNYLHSSILIHCRGGIGRASMIACCILRSIGLQWKPKNIIRLLRKRRDKRAVESIKQEDFVRDYCQYYDHLN